MKSHPATLARLRAASFQGSIASMAQGSSSIYRAIRTSMFLLLVACGAQKPAHVSNTLEAEVTLDGRTYEVIRGKVLRTIIINHRLFEMPHRPDGAWRAYLDDGQALTDCLGTCYGFWMIDNDRVCEWYQGLGQMECFYILRRGEDYYQNFSLQARGNDFRRLELRPGRWQ